MPLAQGWDIFRDQLHKEKTAISTLGDNTDLGLLKMHKDWLNRRSKL